jgi:uncharacterized protein YbaR (Trm112 family)
MTTKKVKQDWTPLVSYAEGFLDGLKATSWTCIDCGNTYLPIVEECPNVLLDEASASLRHAQYKADNE